MKRVYDTDEVGYIEYSDDGKVQAIKKFYGYVYEWVKDPTTGKNKRVRYEEAVYSWHNVGEVLR